jgi:hypothetical protein
MSIPTAEEWLSNNKEMSMYDVASHDEGGYLGIDEKALYKIMNEYANLKSKLHVEAALKEASEQAKTEVVLKRNKVSFSAEYDKVIDKNSILNAYPLENIK